MNKARLDALTARIQELKEAAEAQEAREAPFCEIRIEDLRGDGAARLIHHPAGVTGKAQELEAMTVKSALEWASVKQTPAYVNLITCPLWCYAFYQKSGLYTPKQLELFRQQDIEQYPDIAEITGGADEAQEQQIIDRLATLPQNFWIYPNKSGTAAERKIYL